jgi:hypothetical protein
MHDPQRIKTFATQQCIPPLGVPSLLSSQPAPDFLGPQDRDAAQTYLLHLRHHVKGKKEPSKGFRAKIGVRGEARIEKVLYQNFLQLFLSSSNLTFTAEYHIHPQGTTRRT